MEGGDVCSTCWVWVSLKATLEVRRSKRKESRCALAITDQAGLCDLAI
jgi:hypothetical protein